MSKNGRHYAGRHSAKAQKSKGGAKVVLIIGIIILLAAICLLAFYFLGGQNFIGGNENSESASQSEITENEPIADNAEISVPENTETKVKLKNGITIEKLGSYTGVYMEDGSDEMVSGTAMIMVKNEGDKYIQYAEITVKSGNTEGFFALSTLFPGETVVVLEQGRKTYDKFGDTFTATAENVALFSEKPSLCEDKIKIHALEGAINVTNISESDIEGDVIIYYKNSADDMYYGGITYRVRITGGMKSGETKQIISDHFSASGSTVVFATVS